MSLRQLAERAGLIASPPPAPHTFAGYRALGPPEPDEVTFIGVAVGDDYGAPISLWGANKLSLNVVGAAIVVQLARAMPPDPPVWGRPIPVPVGQYGHVGPFGYLQMKVATPGTRAVVSGAIFRE